MHPACTASAFSYFTSTGWQISSLDKETDRHKTGEVGQKLCNLWPL